MPRGTVRGLLVLVPGRRDSRRRCPDPPGRPEVSVTRHRALPTLALWLGHVLLFERLFGRGRQQRREHRENRRYGTPPTPAGKPNRPREPGSQSEDGGEARGGSGDRGHLEDVQGPCWGSACGLLWPPALLLQPRGPGGLTRCVTWLLLSPVRCHVVVQGESPGEDSLSSTPPVTFVTAAFYPKHLRSESTGAGVSGETCPLSP